MSMRRLILLWGLLLSVCAVAQTPQEKYIQKYAPLAVKEMHRTGVPASITLAQGILESGAGLSQLATKGNNHFGIKCHKDWTGKRMYMDDDRKGECFRVYKKAEDSFRDHSDFLRYRDRYKFLFDLKVTDYKGWAYGLKKAGYATDPHYATKLIKYIEDYKLYRYDKMSTKEAAKVPEPPHKIEEPVIVRPARNGVSVPVSEEFSFNLEGTLYSVNGVPFIYASEGQTYASIAAEHHLFKKEILRFNDLQQEGELLPGTIVYLASKKSKAQAGLEMYIVEKDGEDFHALCQRFAVKEKSILRKNKLSYPVKLREGDEIKLR
ncbi:MAG: glucosaminidase domain-containing protein [Bacteroidales bacterium]|nr:glucosaminidase domain-containing protein [Bacteroidales bacterium]